MSPYQTGRCMGGSRKPLGCKQIHRDNAETPGAQRNCGRSALGFVPPFSIYRIVAGCTYTKGINAHRTDDSGIDVGLTLSPTRAQSADRLSMHFVSTVSSTSLDEMGL
jgi:hypothetical protein